MIAPAARVGVVRDLHRPTATGDQAGRQRQHSGYMLGRIDVRDVHGGKLGKRLGFPLAEMGQRNPEPLAAEIGVGSALRDVDGPSGESKRKLTVVRRDVE